MILQPSAKSFNELLASLRYSQLDKTAQKKQSNNVAALQPKWPQLLMIWLGETKSLQVMKQRNVSNLRRMSGKELEIWVFGHWADKNQMHRSQLCL